MTMAITCRALSKTYPGGVTALSGVDLEIARGQVYGLVGRNGAGKTTLIRILLGLVRATSGGATVLGHDVEDGRRRAQVGSLVETPAFYPYLSGRQNLRLMARYCGVPLPEADRVLDVVGLSERRDTRFSGYSLGMKQRLGIAAALLGEPPLLFLDEPVNGLDPQAIVQVRSLLVSLRDEGRTVLLSSHLLAEVDQVCDRVAILHNGKILAEGSPDEIRDTAAVEAPVLVTVSDSAAAAALLTGVPGVRAVRTPSATELEVDVVGVDPAELTRLLVTAGIDVRRVSHAATLESAYLAMTGEPPAPDVKRRQGA